MNQDIIENKDMPAFPADSKTQDCGGLTKREYFAAMALQGWIASFAGLDTLPNIDIAVKKSIEFADALLAELEK